MGFVVFCEKCHAICKMDLNNCPVFSYSVKVDNKSELEDRVK